MIKKNKYMKYSKISEGEFRLFIRYFVEDLSATQISNLLGISRNSINRYVLGLRKLIVNNCSNNVQGLSEKHTQVSVNFISDSSVNCGSLFVGVNVVDNIVYTSSFFANSDLFQVFINDGNISRSIDVPYDVVMDFSKSRQSVVNSQANNIGLIRGFLSFMKSRLANLNGLDKKYFNLYIKESEFRFNHRGTDMYKSLLRLVRQNPL